MLSDVMSSFLGNGVGNDLPQQDWTMGKIKTEKRA
jgi:hypothetical protein